MNKAKKIGKILLYVLATIILLGWIIKFNWIGSGSNQWELQIDKDGVQVYSLKTPGHYVTQFKSVTKIKASLSQMAASMLLDNHSLENCQDWIPTCIGDVVVEPYSEKAQGDAILWTFDVAPFSPRELLIKNVVQQDPKTKVVTVDVLAAANKMERNDCCVRMTHTHNRWQYTPLGNGEIEVQLIQDSRLGGLFPDFLINLGGAEEAYKLFHDQLPKLVNKEKYKNARFAFIQEP